MIRLLAIGGVIVVLAAFLIGLAMKSGPIPVAAITATRMSAPSVARPGWEVAGAADYFAALHPVPPTPAALAAAAAAKMPKPTPPDVGTLFRHDVGAIVAGPKVLISGMNKGQRVIRTLGPGDLYADGWRLADLSDRTAVLRKGRELRIVNFFSVSPPPVAVAVAKGH